MISNAVPAPITKLRPNPICTLNLKLILVEYIPLSQCIVATAKAMKKSSRPKSGQRRLIAREYSWRFYCMVILFTVQQPYVICPILRFHLMRSNRASRRASISSSDKWSNELAGVVVVSAPSVTGTRSDETLG